jgi:vitamin B12 transporter
MQKITLFLILFTFLSNNLIADDVPVIVIAPSKAPQSLSTVGTSVTVIDEKKIGSSVQSFLGDIIEENTTGNNFWQAGGAGTIMALQFRGLPKAYSTVYVDGVKKSDASTPKNDFYFDDILAGQISKVEVLKGNQSTMYGSGAMGGTVNVFSKQGAGEFKRNLNYNTGNNKTHNINYSYGGSDENKDFYFGLERFQTDGISAMTHNDESDAYKNHTLLTNLGYELSDNLDMRGIFKVVDSKLHYDAINETFDQANNYSHETDGSAVFKINYRPTDKMENRLILNKSYMRRAADNVANQFNNLVIDQTFHSSRETIHLENSYKYNSNHNIVFGAEKEFEEARFNAYDNEMIPFQDQEDFKKGEEITSQYFDVQSSFGKLHTTVGLRRDDHSQGHKEDSKRLTAAYLSDKFGAKFKGSFGTGAKFPTLYEYSAASTPAKLHPETGRSYDLGVEKSFYNKGLNLDLTYFNHKYENAIEGWKNQGYVPGNTTGGVQTEGLEFMSTIKPKKDLDFNLAYTYTSSHDGADFDDPDMGPGSAGNFIISQMVRTPRHLVNIGAQYKLYENLKLKWNTKWSDETRDYGNSNLAGSSGGMTYRDIRLPNYDVHDVGVDFNIKGIKAFAQISNVFNEKYSQSAQYTGPERAFNLAFKKLY